MEKIEKDLILLGEAAVEDKLQNGVPECIEKLAQAGIKIWVLTGDKIETAINIGFACSLLRQGMKQIIITLETPEIKELEKTGNKDLVAKESKESIAHQIRQGKTLLTSTNTETSALIIDGKSLLFALDDNLKSMFLELANGCASVMCCRTSPKQKAPVTRLVKTDTSRVTLAIGDGANDVGMLQEADIGIRISGAEGMQFPLLYQLGVQNILFSWLRILGWMLNGVLNAIVIFFFCTKSLEHQAFRRSGEVVGLEILGAAMYTCILWVVNLQMALAINYFTLIQHAFIWGSIILWYLFLLAFGAVTPIISTTAFMVFEGLAAAPLYWAATLFVVVATLIPYFTCKAIQTQFFPMYHEILQWIWLEEQSNDPENYQMICEGLGNL